MEQTIWGFWLPILLGGIQTVYTVLGYYRDKRTKARGALTMKRPYAVMGILLVLTWAAVGFDYWDRHRPGIPLGEQVMVNRGIGWWPPECHVTLRTAALLGFRKEHKIAFLCGVQDQVIDELNERRMVASDKFTITGGDVTITKFFTPEMVAVAGSKKEHEENGFWFAPVLVPKDTDMTAIHCLSDVTKYGGKILLLAYFE